MDPHRTLASSRNPPKEARRRVLSALPLEGVTVLGRELEALSHSTSRGGTRHSWLGFWLQSRWWGRTWGRTGWARVDGCQHRPLPRPLPQFPGSGGQVLMIKVKDEDRRARWVGRENKQQKTQPQRKPAQRARTCPQPPELSQSARRAPGFPVLRKEGCRTQASWDFTTYGAKPLPR